MSNLLLVKKINLTIYFILESWNKIRSKFLKTNFEILQNFYKRQNCDIFK